jgi:hypothetical protein
MTTSDILVLLFLRVLLVALDDCFVIVVLLLPLFCAFTFPDLLRIVESTLPFFFLEVRDDVFLVLAI